MTNSQAASHESWLVRYSPALQDLVEAIPIVSDNGLPILTLHLLFGRPVY